MVDLKISNAILNSDDSFFQLALFHDEAATFSPSTMRKTNVFFLSVVLLLSANASPDPQVTPPPTPTIAKRQVAGGAGTPILSTLHYAYTALPYQVYPYAVLRGPQYGFNQCNASTLGPTSNCQTLIFNGPVRSCLFSFRLLRLMRWRLYIGRFLSLGIPRSSWAHRE